MIGAGAVVTKNIGKNELWLGNPAKHVGYVTNDGIILDFNLKSKNNLKNFKWFNNKLIQIQ